MSFRHLPALLLVLPLLALAGCGGGEDSEGSGGSAGAEQKDDAAAVYEKAVKQLDVIKSGRVSANLGTVLRFGETQEIKLAEKVYFTGEGGLALPKFQIGIDVVQANGEKQTTEVVNTGDTLYTRPQGSDAFQNQGEEAVAAMASTYRSEQQGLEEGRIPMLALTPSDWAKKPRVDGKAQADGVAVQRVVADLDVPAFLRDLEDAKGKNIGFGVSLSDAARKLLEPDAKVDKQELVALVGEDDGRLRRLTAMVDGDVGGQVIVDFDVKLTQIDKPQGITAPR